MEAIAVIGLGANLGDPPRQIHAALAALAAVTGLSGLRSSRLVRSAPLGGPPGQPDYANAVARGHWSGTATALLIALQAIESRLGRQRSIPWGPRTVDLDLLVCGAECRDTPELHLPHPGITQRAFVLQPWCELAPDDCLPGSRLTICALWQAGGWAPLPVWRCV